MPDIGPEKERFDESFELAAVQINTETRWLAWHREGATLGHCPMDPTSPSES